MFKILSIGNSFSQDAQRYLHDFAKAADDDILCCNLMIGGCSLEIHWKNFVSGEPAYEYEVNGQAAKEKISLPDALARESWDAITIQQNSPKSGKPDTYVPYLPNLVEAIRAMCPDATLYLHETWEYEHGADHFAFPDYRNDEDVMYQAFSETYKYYARELQLSMIPSGDIFHVLNKTDTFRAAVGGQSLYRDGSHVHMVYGRYLLACIWYKVLLKKNPQASTYVPEDGPSEPRLLALLQETVQKFRYIV